MRTSIRGRILIPLIAIQAVAVTATTFATVALAARRGEREMVDRLNGVIEAMGRASFPRTAGVLARMNGLSGAHFVAYDADGRVTEASLPGLGRLPAGLRAAPAGARIASLGASPRAVVGGISYLAVPLGPAASAPGAGSLLVLYPETSWRRARWEAAMPPLLLGLGSIGTMAAVTGWIAHRVGVRIRKVERRVARIAEGDFRGLDLGRERDEVHDLSLSINRMCAQLRDLHRAVEGAERARLLAQFAAGLAHQLRNSLTGARMSVQLHARRHPAPDGDESLAVALRQLAITEEQVKGLLSLGRVERPAPEVRDLRELVEEVALLVGPTCRHARVVLRVSGGGPAERLVDPPGIRAAILNLALNAIEAAGAGGEVGLALLPDGDGATVEVSDSGPGPPAALASTLCQPFVTSKPEGVGLGLAIAQQVATEHGGRLSWARDGGRTRFFLALPGPVTERKGARWAGS